MTMSEPTVPIEESLEGQIGPLLPQFSAWLSHIGVPHQTEEGALGMVKQARDMDFEVVWDELPGILRGFVALLEPLGAGEDPNVALQVLESIEPIPPRFLEVASYAVESDGTPGMYVRLRMPLRFAPETATDALELISYMVDRHAVAQTGGGEER